LNKFLNLSWLARGLFSVLALLYIILAVQFIWHDGLATFASDSSNYLVMARYLSPWQPPSAPITEIWSLQYFPPLFPLLLGLSGTASNLPAAHVFTFFLLGLSLPLLYRYLATLLDSAFQALILTSLFVLSPSTWLNILGILSENLYLLLSLGCLLLYPRLSNSKVLQSVLFGVMLGALLLTRTIGIAMFGAYLMACLPRWYRGELSLLTCLLPAGLGISLFIVAGWFQDASAPALYLDQISVNTLWSQAVNIREAWHTGWQFYWLDAQPLPTLVISVFGILAIAGLGVRLVQFQLDAWYVLLYLAIILIWPYPGQGLRFLFPLQALLIGHAAYFAALQCRKLPVLAASRVMLGLLLLLAVVILPAQAFLYNRYQAGSEYGFQHYVEFYNRSELPDALAAGAMQQAMANDLARIGTTTPESALILGYEPSLLVLLAQRRSFPIEAYISEAGIFDPLLGPAPDFMYLSKMHPRNTGSFNGLALQGLPENRASPVWIHQASGSEEPLAVFYAIPKPL